MRRGGQELLLRRVRRRPFSVSPLACDRAKSIFRERLQFGDKPPPGGRPGREKPAFPSRQGLNALLQRGAELVRHGLALEVKPHSAGMIVND
jgi:hypothetical protein